MSDDLMKRAKTAANWPDFEEAHDAIEAELTRLRERNAELEKENLEHLNELDAIYGVLGTADAEGGEPAADSIRGLIHEREQANLRISSLLGALCDLIDVQKYATGWDNGVTDPTGTISEADYLHGLAMNRAIAAFSESVATGEKGNWNGARPVRERIASLEAAVREMREALEKIRKADIRHAGCNSEDAIEYDGPVGKIAAAALASSESVVKSEGENDGE